MMITRQLTELPRTSLTWHELWEGPDKGIVACWERGLEKSQEDPAMAIRALAGELLVLPWRGGIDKPAKGKKFGTYFYLAMWQGLRRDPLNINTAEELVLVCSRTGTQVTYTANASKCRKAASK